MPRGNDAINALKDLYSQYGPHSNASELIRAQTASVDPAVQKLGDIQVDPDATAEYKAQDGWTDKAASDLGLPEGSEVLDVAVRGNGLSVVYVDPFGDVHKAAGAANENYKPPVLSPAQARIRAEAAADAEVNVEIATLRAEGQAKLEAFKAELDAAAAEAIAEAREKAQADVEKATEDAEAEAEEADSADSSESDKPATAAKSAPKRGAAAKS